MKDKLYTVIRKARYNMSVVHMDNKLEKDILDIVSKNIIQNDKFIIEDMNIICNDIKESVIRNKYNKIILLIR
jgi:hypothetical protein